jgi:histidinol dehydrogenase
MSENADTDTTAGADDGASLDVPVRTVADLSPDERRAVFERAPDTSAVHEDVAEIVERVRTEGDAALREFAREFDGVDVGNIEITGEAARAYNGLDTDLRLAIDRAAENVQEFHEAQLPDDWRETFDGRVLGRRFRPIDRAGVYVPGGAAAYPSSAIMGVVPANVAGVEEVSVVTPPEPAEATLAAVYAAGADSVYAVGGAQAVAALAYGTETVDRVQKVVGPGNKYVTAAKAQVRGQVEIDFLAGPSELLVVADETSDTAYVAADLLAQAEHDPDAAVAAVTASEDVAETLVAELDRQIRGRERAETIRAAFENDGSGVFLARSMSEAVLFAEEYAAEHLSIQADDDEALASRITNAGSVFLGDFTPVAAGDYATGTNHVLPTGGGAKVHGGLSVDTFLRSSTVQRLDSDTLRDLSDTITALAEAEGLEAHAESVRRRVGDRPAAVSPEADDADPDDDESAATSGE